MGLWGLGGRVDGAMGAMSKKLVIATVVTVKGAEIVQPLAVLDAVFNGDFHSLTPLGPR